MRRSALLVLLFLPLAGAQALDPDSPSLEFVMRVEDGGLAGNTYHYELHPKGAHEPLNGKFYGSSEYALDGHRQFVLTMPYANPEATPLERGAPVNASFVFGVTNRGEGTYNATWALLADETTVATGAATAFDLVGQGTDVGYRQVTWTSEALIDELPEGAVLRLEIDVDFSGNAPFVKDRGIVIDLPPRMEAVEDAPPTGTETSPETTANRTVPAVPSAAESTNGTASDPTDADVHGARGASEAPLFLRWIWVPVLVMGAVLFVARRR